MQKYKFKLWTDIYAKKLAIASLIQKDYVIPKELENSVQKH